MISSFVKLFRPASAYEYQKKLVQDALVFLLSPEHQNPVVLAGACNSGKTYMSIDCGRKYNQKTNRPVLVLAHGQTVLRSQYYEELKKNGIENCVLIESLTQLQELAVRFKNADTNAPWIAVTLPQTILKATKEDLQQFGLLIVDEAHDFYFGEKMIARYRSLMGEHKELLLTGTPSDFIAANNVNKDSFNILSLAPEVLLDNGVSESPIIELGVSHYNFRARDYNVDDNLSSKTASKFTRDQTVKTLDDLLVAIESKLSSGWRVSPEGGVIAKLKNLIHKVTDDLNWTSAIDRIGKTLIVAHNQLQAAHISEYLKERGVNALTSTSDNDHKSLNVDKFKRGEVNVLVVVGRCNVGFNDPEMINIIDISGSLNPDRLFQMIARIYRKASPSFIKNLFKPKKLFLKLMPEHLLELSESILNFTVALNIDEVYRTYDGRYQNILFPIHIETINRKPKEIKEKTQENYLTTRPVRSLIDVIDYPLMKRIYSESKGIGEQRAYESYSWMTLKKLKELWQSQEKRWLSFEEARQWARTSGIKSNREWFASSRAGRIPTNIPSNPQLLGIYKNEWRGWQDFLGTDKSEYLSFEEARLWARASGIKTKKEWYVSRRAGRIPSNIPTNLHIVEIYKNKWLGWCDFLGTKNSESLRFNDARQWARASGIKTQKEWFDASSEKKIPPNIPSNPQIAGIYKKEWLGWGDFLGTGRRSPKGTYLSFEKARDWAQRLEYKNVAEWLKARKEGLIPKEIPVNPQAFYKKDWLGWPDFLGYDNKRRSEFLTFSEAREWARSSGLKSSSKWFSVIKAGSLPSFIPTNPHIKYKDEWISWIDFLGTNGQTSKSNFLSFEKAREYARLLQLKNRSDWFEKNKHERISENIPKDPYKTYGAEWRGWEDFLGIDVADQVSRKSSRQFWLFEHVRAWARTSGIKTMEEWRIAWRTNRIPEGVPSWPNEVYKKQWLGWRDFLGTTDTTDTTRIRGEYLPFDEARRWAQTSEIKTKQDWFKASKERRLPEILPSRPDKVYKAAWLTWADFLGTKATRTKVKYLPYDEARIWAKASGIKTSKDWCKAGKERLLPENLPSRPDNVYKGDWQSWGDFLGTDTTKVN